MSTDSGEEGIEDFSEEKAADRGEEDYAPPAVYANPPDPEIPPLPEPIQLQMKAPPKRPYKELDFKQKK